MLTHNEAIAYLRQGDLPADFEQRLRNQLELEPCSNCDNVRCIHMRMRDWWGPDFDACDGWCCPSCSDFRHYLASNTEGAAT